MLFYSKYYLLILCFINNRLQFINNLILIPYFSELTVMEVNEIPNKAIVSLIKNGLYDFYQHKKNYNTAHESFRNDPTNFWLLGSNRLHKMFLRNCSTQILPYEQCLGEPNWKYKIDSYISENQKKNCYSEWVKVRRCSTKYLGESFSEFLDTSRNLGLGEKMESERNSKEYFEHLHKRRIELNKEAQGPSSG